MNMNMNMQTAHIALASAGGVTKISSTAGEGGGDGVADGGGDGSPRRGATSPVRAGGGGGSGAASARAAGASRGGRRYVVLALWHSGTLHIPFHTHTHTHSYSPYYRPRLLCYGFPIIAQSRPEYECHSVRCGMARQRQKHLLGAVECSARPRHH